MSVAIEIKPVWSEEQQKQVATTLVVTIDLSKVQPLLAVYNLLLLATVRTSIPVADRNQMEVREYPYTFVEENTGQQTFSFEAVVLGVIEDINQVKVSAKGYCIRK